MQTLRFLFAIALSFMVGSCPAAEKLYVAVEGTGRLAVIDPHTLQITRNIDLAEHGANGHTPFAPHNVQVAPDGRSVWLTAMAGGHGTEHGEHAAAPADQVIVIDPITDAITQRIPIAAGVHLAHVALTPDSRYAYVTAQDDGSVYKIDAQHHRIDKRLVLPPRSQPHGLRISPNDGHAYVALLGGHAMAALDLRTDRQTILPLPGAAVQTAITPSGSLVFASLYDTRQIAVFNPASRSLSTLNLPSDSKGPVQLYPTPDGRYLIVADQGHYFNQPANRVVYKLDIYSGRVVAQIPSGEAPHGVVVAPYGNRAYITNLLSGDVSVLDTEHNSEIARIPVGSKPNGISLWSSISGGTP